MHAGQAGQNLCIVGVYAQTLPIQPAAPQSLFTSVQIIVLGMLCPTTLLAFTGDQHNLLTHSYYSYTLLFTHYRYVLGQHNHRGGNTGVEDPPECSIIVAGACFQRSQAVDATQVCGIQLQCLSVQPLCFANLLLPSLRTSHQDSLKTRAQPYAHTLCLAMLHMLLDPSVVYESRRLGKRVMPVAFSIYFSAAAFRATIQPLA